MNASIQPDTVATRDSERGARARLARRLRLLGENASDWWQRDDLVLAERTPWTEVFREDIHCVRHYDPLAETHIEMQGERIPVNPETYAIPLVLVSPLAVTMRNYDLFPDRSLVKYLRARGFNVYLVDWGRPEKRHDDMHLADFYAGVLPRALAAIRAHSGSQKVSLHGWSFGALFSLCHAASGDPDIANLVLVGAPCDYHANGAIGKQYQRIATQLQRLESGFGFRLHDTQRKWWRSPGWANSLAFKAISPVATLQGYLDLLRNLHDREFVTAHATNAAFIDDMTAYPGGVVQDIVQYLWGDNCLAQGRLPDTARRGDFHGVKSDLFMVVGEDDTIVMPQASRPLLDLVGSAQRECISVPGGHMGILGGSRAPATVWKPVADWLSTRS